MTHASGNPSTRYAVEYPGMFAIKLMMSAIDARARNMAIRPISLPISHSTMIAAAINTPARTPTIALTLETQ